MSKNEILGIVLQLLANKYSVSDALLIAENYSKPLFEAPIGLSELDLTYLCFDLQRVLNTEISSKQLQNYGFLTIDGIVSALSNTLVS